MTQLVKCFALHISNSQRSEFSVLKEIKLNQNIKTTLGEMLQESNVFHGQRLQSAFKLISHLA